MANLFAELKRRHIYRVAAAYAVLAWLLKLLTEAAGRMRLTARGYHRVLHVARTIADLAGVQAVNRNHLAEALSYRRIAHAG